MTSAIYYSDITTTYPIPGRDNDSQGFRTNFSLIKDGLETAANEISLLQAQKADLIGASIFTNNTPSYSTYTGAVVVTGGVGIGGDLYVGGSLNVSGGGAAVSTTTVYSVTTPTDIVLSGTVSQPVFRLATSIAGHKSILGTLAIGSANPSTSNGLYVTTTSTAQTTFYSKVSNAGGTSIKLDTYSDTGSTFTFIKFVKSPNNVETTLGTVTHNGTQLVYSGSTKFTDALGCDTTLTTNKLVVNGTAPAARTSTGVLGQVAVDNSYLYVCTGTNTWTRIALAPYGTW